MCFALQIYQEKREVRKKRLAEVRSDDEQATEERDQGCQTRLVTIVMYATKLKATYFKTNSSATLLDCFHCVFYLEDAALWTPSDHIRIILHISREYYQHIASMKGGAISAEQ
jgi:hypothetical protein